MPKVHIREARAGTEDRACNTCGDRRHFGMSKLCRKKKKATRRVKEEQKETSSESSDSKGEQEVNRVIWDQVWPGTSATARKRYVRHIKAEGGKKDESKSGDESESSNKNEDSDTKAQQENNQVIGDQVWPGRREKARKRNTRHTAGEGGM